MIHFHFETDAPAFNQTQTIRWLKKVCALHKKSLGEIHYVICSDERILEINRRFLQHDYYTDVITFDYSQGERIAGDIYLSVETIQSNAAERNLLFEQEWNRVLVHGVLHLCGYSDKSPQDEQKMRQLENEALVLL